MIFTRIVRTSNRQLLAAAATAAALFVAAPTASAQRYPGRGVETHMVTVGVGGGASVPTTGNVRDALKTGVNWHGFVGVRPGMGLPMLRFAVDYQKFDFKREALVDPTTGGGTGTPTSVTDAQTKILGGLANLGVDLLHGPVRPYILAGVGAFNVKTEGKLSSGGEAFSKSKTQFGIDGGAGLAVNIGRIAAFVEGRVQNVYTDKGAIDTKSITTVPVTFGLQF